MNQQREHEALLAAQKYQELREQEQEAQEKEEPPQNSVFRQLIKEMCRTKVYEEQKQNMEDTMLELLKDCRQKELYYMHNDEVENIVEQAPKRKTRITKCLKNFKVIHNESIIPLIKTPQISSVNAITPDLPTEKPNESEGIFGDTCDVHIYKDSSTFDALKDHSEILSDSNDDDTSSDDDVFEDIEYIEATLPDSELVSLEESPSSYPIPVEDSDPFMEETDISFSYTNNSIPEFEAFSFLNDHTGERSSGSTITHADISLPVYDRFTFDIEPDSGELISAVMNNIDELNEDECFDPGGGEIDVFSNFEDDDYFPFIFVIRIFLPHLTYHMVSSLLLSTGSEDTIFDPDISS
nr:hypothetical protein [Tanacetum cinerariifolium]